MIEKGPLLIAKKCYARLLTDEQISYARFRGKTYAGRESSGCATGNQYVAGPHLSTLRESKLACRRSSGSAYNARAEQQYPARRRRWLSASNVDFGRLRLHAFFQCGSAWYSTSRKPRRYPGRSRRDVRCQILMSGRSILQFQPIRHAEPQSVQHMWSVK